jgi:hypothetical protein
MTFRFEPALQLAGTPTVFILSLNDATGVLREYAGRRPATRDSILRRLTAASSEQEAGEAAKSFRWFQPKWLACVATAAENARPPPAGSL